MATTTQTVNWSGQSRKQYTYYVYRIGTTLKKAPGNYIFAKQTPTGWSPIYIGETSDLSERFDNHHKMPCITKAGATHIHAHVNNSGVTARRAEESDLIKQWNPPCNG